MDKDIMDKDKKKFTLIKGGLFSKDDKDSSEEPYSDNWREKLFLEMNELANLILDNMEKTVNELNDVLELNDKFRVNQAVKIKTSDGFIYGFIDKVDPDNETISVYDETGEEQILSPKNNDIKRDGIRTSDSRNPEIKVGKKFIQRAFGDRQKHVVYEILGCDLENELIISKLISSPPNSAYKKCCVFSSVKGSVSPFPANMMGTLFRFPELEQFGEKGKEFVITYFGENDEEFRAIVHNIDTLPFHIEVIDDSPKECRNNSDPVSIGEVKPLFIDSIEIRDTKKN